MPAQLTIIGLAGVPMVQPGDDLAALTLAAYAATKRLAIIISDSFGRPWRRGTVGIALGVAGLPSVIDWRGQPDLFGRKLEVTETGFADEIAAAASIVQGQAAEATPIIVVRGLSWTAPDAPAAAIVRPPEHDLFR